MSTREGDTNTSTKSKTDKQLIAATGAWVTTVFVLLAALIVFVFATSGTWSTDVMRILMSLGISLSVLAGTAATTAVQFAVARNAKHRADRRAVDLLAGLQGIARNLRDSWADELLDTRTTLLAAIATIDERRRVAVDAIERHTRERIAELAARADERHAVVLDNIAGLTEKIERTEAKLDQALTPESLATVRDLKQRIADGPNGHNGAGHKVRPRDGA